MATSDDARESVHDLAGDNLAAYIAAHVALWGYPPMAGGAPDDDGDDEGDDDTPDDADAEGDDDDTDTGDDDPDDDDAEGGAAHWKSHSRKHERDKKALATKLKERDAELAKLKRGTQSTQEKAIADAREEAKKEAQREIREVRLESACVRLGTGFADPEDALIQVEAAVKRGDLAEDDLYDENGKVDADVLGKALKGILKRKPNLAGDGKRFKGSTDARRGAGGKKSLDDLTEDEHFQAIRRKK